jgi:hypothetical protein
MYRTHELISILEASSGSVEMVAARLLARVSRQGAAVAAAAARRQLCGVTAAAAKQPFASSRCSARVRFSGPFYVGFEFQCCFSIWIGLHQGLIRGSIGILGCGGVASELIVSGWGS